MAAGTLVLLIAFADEFVLSLKGRRKSAGPGAALHNE